MCMFCRSFICPFVLFLLAIVLSVLLWLTDSDYPFGIFRLFLCHMFMPQCFHLVSRVLRRWLYWQHTEHIWHQWESPTYMNKCYYLNIAFNNQTSFDGEFIPLFLVLDRFFLSTPYNLISQIQYTCYRNFNAFIFQLFFSHEKTLQYLIDYVVVWHSISAKLGLWLRKFVMILDLK